MLDKKILVIDDEPGALVVLQRSLSKKGYRVLTATSGEEGLRQFSETTVPVVVTDINMPGMDGLDVLRAVIKERPETVVILMTAYADVESAVEALRGGAYDYIVKPFKPEVMLRALERAFEKLRLSDEVSYLRRQVQSHYGFESIVGNSGPLRGVLKAAHRIAPSEESVLITGPSGTGKELFARAMHLASPRSEKRFVAVNCGALPEHLMESELFGHVKGSFTGATCNKIGLIQEADSGTIFFDEVAELPLPMQVKLLRFLQDHNVRSVGGTDESHVDVRVIAATNRDLRAAVDAGRFREDLYFRLRVLTLEIPPLAARKEDIPLLLSHFMEKFSERRGGGAPVIGPEAERILLGYSWPGNGREVENVVKHILVMCDGAEVTAEDLPAFLRDTAPQAPAKESYLSEGLSYSEARAQVLEEFNQQIIAEALAEENGNITRAAERLGTAKSNVVRLMKRFGMKRDEP